MVRRASFAALVTGLLILAFGAVPRTSAPIKLARHPDYHAGKIAFSYLGDIWTANEDGGDPHRLTDNRGHEVYPRFSPDGRWIAFSSNRYGNNDVFVCRDRRRAAAPDVPHRQRRRGRVDSRFATGPLPRGARRRRVSERGDAVSGAGRRRPRAAAARRLGLLGQLFARRQVARLQPPSRGVDAPALSRQLRGGSVDCRPEREDLHASCCPTSGTTATGRCGAPTAPSTTSPIRCRTTRASCRAAPTSARARTTSTRFRRRRAAGAGHAARRRQPVLAVDVERRQGDRLRRAASASGSWTWPPGKTSEIKIEIDADEKDNEHDVETVTNDVDAFDISPSGRRAVISARGQILTIATDRGDITRVAPDTMASRNQAPKWSPDGKYHRVRLGSIRARRSLDQRSGREDAEEDHRSRQREGLAGVVAGLEDAAVHRRGQEALQLHRRRRQDGDRDVERRQPPRVCRRLARQQVGERSPSRIARCARTSTSRRSAAARSGTSPKTGCSIRRTNAVWTADGRYIVFTSAEGFSNGIATQGGIGTTMELWALSLRDQDRDPMNRDIDNEAQGLAAEAAGAAERRAVAVAAARRRCRTCASTGTASRAARAG